MRRNQITIRLILVGAALWVGLSSLMTSWQSHLKNRLLAETSAEVVVTSQSALAPSTQPALKAPSASQVLSASAPVSASGKIDSKELEFKMPDRETYRAQVIARKNQEGAGLPPVLREFSVRMTELMEKASQSPTFAAALFDRLKECSTARHGHTIHQARTICAVNAIRLGEIHPQTLGTQAKSFRESLPARLKTRIIALGF